MGLGVVNYERRMSSLIRDISVFLKGSNSFSRAVRTRISKENIATVIFRGSEPPADPLPTPDLRMYSSSYYREREVSKLVGDVSLFAYLFALYI